MSDDARTLDFLEGSGAPLAVDWKAPDLTAEQLAASAAGRASFTLNQIRADAAKTAAINVPYTQIRAATNEATVLASNYVSTLPIMHQGEGAWNFGGQDYGLLPVAVAVIAPLVAIAATGGLAAPAVGALWKQMKSTAKAATAVRSYGDIKGVVDQVGDIKARVLKVPNLVKDNFIAAQATADRILSDPSIDGHAIIANTQALASTGDIDAQRGAVILAQVAGARVRAGVGQGQSLLPVKTPEQAALVANIAARTLVPLTGSDLLKVSDVRQGWWKRLIHWLEEKL